MVAATLGLAVGILGFPADTIDRSGLKLTAHRLTEMVRIDGRLDETVWQSPPTMSNFIQSEPNEGAPATERTEVHLAFDDEAFYVAARLFDRQPDSVLARLTRRDNDDGSDLFAFYVDPYHDGRTGYQFLVSAAGQQLDGTLYNDNWSDNSWNGVWHSAVQHDSAGWTVEMRIPLSQLRMRDDGVMTWGVNAGRALPRNSEGSYLIPRLRQGSGFVSRFAVLEGLEGLRPRRRLEVLPYVTARADFEPAAAGNPFSDGSSMSPAVGGDLRLGLGSSLQLDATINPDFGQVEVDPAVVNLGDIETFLEERRPFFVEGSNSFSFGNNGASNYMGFNWVDNASFYSRRIGRAPQGGLPGGVLHSNQPEGTRILGATKLTGRLGAWDLGLLAAATRREYADVLQGTAERRIEIEPLAGYGVLRLQRDFAGGDRGIGFLATLAKRDFDDAGLRSQVNATALVTGIEGWMALDTDGEWMMSGYGLMSRISGTPERIDAVQRGATQYFQRPDAEHLEYDPARTSLSGGLLRLNLNREHGATLFNAAIGAVTPGFENNDLGYIGSTDIINAHMASGYRWTEPRGVMNNARMQLAAFSRWDFGGTRTSTGVWSNNDITWRDNSASWLGAFYQTAATNVRATRGGPAMRSPQYLELNAGWESDSRKSVEVEVYGNWHTRAQGAGNGWSAGTNLAWRPRSNISFSAGPELAFGRQKAQYLTSVEDPFATGTFGRRYVFGGLYQRTLAANLRLNWVFSPAFSLELFAQPLVSSGRYETIRELKGASSYDFLDYGTEGSVIDRGTGMVDPDGAGPAQAFQIGQPDFTIASLRGNAVLRWEYAPGSTLFLVWTQLRDGHDEVGEFRPGRAVSRLLEEPGRNVVMLKLSYWLGR